ncbi:hypothetical protein FB567DRAFT_555398 [Paraphoma chrysanthemicola]|uniref:Uncharacterized protein n=1 Tax=Paraphoma chrysanthemicola TaxID=798071 RepID=A0A8K0QSC2_9PLEO|nr:hypothetical protein FB567DRAFT_555398 [Paraphoma chrysanthemicola]
MDFDVVNHSFILPVEYINSWFLESTWPNIETNGRVEGRPHLDDAVILRELATKEVSEEQIELGSMVTSSVPRSRRELNGINCIDSAEKGLQEKSRRRRCRQAERSQRVERKVNEEASS